MRGFLLAAGLLLVACAADPGPASQAGPNSAAGLTFLATPAPYPKSFSGAPPSLVQPSIEPPSSSVPSEEQQPAETFSQIPLLEGAMLVEALRGGGYVIYFRHAATDPAQTDLSTENLKDCSLQRNLNPEGRDQARAVGQAFLSLDIPVGQVLSSGFCRAFETALLAFGRAEIAPDLTGFPAGLRESRIAALRQMLSTPPLPGSNSVLVAHGFNIANTAGISIAEGEAAVFAPLEAGGFTLAALVQPEEWAGLALDYGGPAAAQQAATATPIEPSPALPTPPPTSNPALNLGAPPDDPNLMLPDLQSLPPADLSIEAGGPGGQKLLRLSHSVVNSGPGALELWGAFNPASGKTQVTQHIYRLDSSVQERLAGEFVFHPGHDHWHMENFARYELWSLGLQGDLEALAAITDKVSFCLRDNTRSGSPDQSPLAVYTSQCGQERQGISAGWVDTYKYHLPGQTVDISGVPDGAYALRSIVDQDDQIWELDSTNNTAMVYVEIKSQEVRIIESSTALRRLLETNHRRQ